MFPISKIAPWKSWHSWTDKTTPSTWGILHCTKEMRSTRQECNGEFKRNSVGFSCCWNEMRTRSEFFISTSIVAECFPVLRSVPKACPSDCWFSASRHVVWSLNQEWGLGVIKAVDTITMVGNPYWISIRTTWKYLKREKYIYIKIYYIHFIIQIFRNFFPKFDTVNLY